MFWNFECLNLCRVNLNVAKDEADLASLQMRNWQNNIVTPFLTLVEIGREIRNRAVERSCRDYENRYAKAEADARKHAKVDFIE